MAAGGLIYAVITLAVMPGVVHRFRAAGAGNHDVDTYVAVIWLGAAVALVVAVILFALFVVLGVALRRGSNGARIGTLVISVLGVLGGAVAAVTVLIERSGDGTAGSLGGRLSGAYPGGWIGTNAALAVAQVLAYVIVLILVLRAPRAFFGGGPGMPPGAHGQMPPIYGGSFPPGYAGAQPGYPAAQPGYPGVGQPGYPMPAQGQHGYPGSASGQPFYARPGEPGYPAPGPVGYAGSGPGQSAYPGQAGYMGAGPGQPGYAAPGQGQPGYAGPGADQSGYAAPHPGQSGYAAPGQPEDAATYPGQPGYPGGQPAQPSEYAAPGTPGQPGTPVEVSPSSDPEAPRKSDSGHGNAAPNATETASPEPIERTAESGEASYHGAPTADNGPRTGDTAAPGAIPSEGPSAPGKPAASVDEYWKRPGD
jgi:hypothetical protein